MKEMEIVNRKRTNLFALLFITFLFGTMFVTSCRNKAVVEDYRQIAKTGWNQDTVLVFELPIDDPKKVYDLNFHIRNTGKYPYSNLWLFVAIIPPSGKTTADTIELTLAKPTGEWIGSGLGGLYEGKYPFKKTIFFPEIGKYTVTVRQGMRTKDGLLKGISDFGLSLDKAI